METYNKLLEYVEKQKELYTLVDGIELDPETAQLLYEIRDRVNQIEDYLTSSLPNE